MLAALAELARAPDDRGPPDAAAAFDATSAHALAGTVWHSGCTNWYVDENGNDPRQWPWSWRSYRRRTATLDPGASSTS